MTTSNALDPAVVPLLGRHLVEASAGTGKTYTISTLFVRLVVEAGLSAEQILVVTFTRAATAELRDRIRRRLREALDVLEGDAPKVAAKDPVFVKLVLGWSPDAARRRLASALQTFDLAPISTIHGFCQRALRENAFESGVAFDLELAEDRGPLVRQVAQDLWTAKLFHADRTFVEWLQGGELAFADVVSLAHQAVRAAPPVALPVELPPPLSDEGERLHAAFKAAATAWRQHGVEAVRLIDACGVLDGRSYRSAYTSKHAEAIARAFDGVALPFGVEAFEKALDYLDPARMHEKRSRAAVDAGTPVPTNAALDAVGALRLAWSAAIGAFVGQRVRLCAEVMRDAPAALERARRASGELQFFDDLIVDLDRALADDAQGPPLAGALRTRFPAALIDEFQDTDPVQWRIFDRVWQGDVARLFLIGDPKQAIYAFRGADLFAYLGARDTVPTSRRWDLDTNYRSDAPLVEAVNHVFQLGTRPFADDGIPFLPVKAANPVSRLRVDGVAPPPLELRLHRSRPGRGGDWCDGYELPDVVADGIVDLLSGRAELVVSKPDEPEVRRPLDPGDVAVLVSAHWEAAEVQAALERRGVPCVRYGNVRVFATPEASELQALMEGVARPGDLKAVRAALVTRPLGLVGDDLGALEADEGALQAWLERFRAWRATWDARGFVRMFQQVLHDTDALPRVLATDGGERCLTNLRHLAELVHAAEQGQGLEPLGALAWLGAQRAGRADGDSPAEVRLESDEAAVQVVTMHVSKGLEYPVVFCPYLWRPSWRDTFPSFHEQGGLRLQLHPEAFPDDAERALAEARAERLRLAYVALTRAKNLCVVTWGRFRGKDAHFAHSALAHLLCPPPDGGLPGSHDDVVAAMDDAALFRSASALAEGSGGRVGVRWVERDTPRRFDRAREAPRLLPPPAPPARSWPNDLRLSSYSGLVRVAHEQAHRSGYVPEDRDVDALVVAPPPTAASTLRLAGFPKGAAAGTAYHAAMEGLDFERLQLPEARAHVARALELHGVDPVVHADAVLASIVDVCGADLGDGAPALGVVPLTDRLDELGFTLPAGVDAPLTPERLAAVFEAHLPERLRRPVAARLRDLRFPPLEGFLKGFVDLAFRAPGPDGHPRWYVVDYKTNHLGPALDDYGADAIDRAMIEGDYVLQYHLYVVALHRFLRRRVAGWDYARDFGGVRYLFVRGMTPEAGPSRGVFADRPSPAMVEALDAVLGSPS